MNNYRYPWPASALGSDDMALLYSARESADTRVPITKLLAQAVRAVYGKSTNKSTQQSETR